MNHYGMLIFRERIRRNWSQEGLCRGICTVSYLSKIENGKAEPSAEIVQLLLQRLELETSPELEREAKQLAEEGYELLFTNRRTALQMLLADMQPERYRATAVGMDLSLLCQMNLEKGQPLENALESGMNARQMAMQRLLQGRYREAVALLPNAYTHFRAGMDAYNRGEYLEAQQDLQTAYELAAQEGAPYIMLDCKAFMGNCYSNRRDIPRMQEQYAVARRLAAALNDADMLRKLDYNTASTQIEAEEYEAAYAFFVRLENPDLMSLHKLAICCEMTGRQAEGIDALARAGQSERTELELRQARQMCALVEYRLTHPDYLKEEAYGALLMDCFDMCRKELPAGYAWFHLPWVTEWYKATRQYKKALELIEEFSS